MNIPRVNSGAHWYEPSGRALGAADPNADTTARPAVDCEMGMSALPDVETTESHVKNPCAEKTLSMAACG